MYYFSRKISYMINFPEFKKIYPEDREFIESFTNSSEPFSDYNFLSLWCWDIRNTREVSTLNNNLIVKFTDYLSGLFVYSLYGSNDIDNTMQTLLNYSIGTGGGQLKYVPEIAVAHVKNDSFIIEEDRDNFDYIISTELLSTMSGGDFKSKRHLATKCQDLGEKLKIIHSEANPESRNQILIFMKTLGDKQSNEEYSAIARLLDGIDFNLKFLTTLAYLDGIVVGFSIDEIATQKTAISHFFKTNKNVTGLSEYLNMTIARKLYNEGIIYWNWEQDLGLEHLRRMKLGYRPIAYQKKYTIGMVADVNK